jgi:hypothetical protein
LDFPRIVDTSEAIIEAADAGLPGIYRAWTIGEDSPDMDKLFTRSLGPYVLVNGTVVANNWDDLTDGTLAAPINLNEKGELTSLEVWTNVAVDGTQLNSTAQTHATAFKVPAPLSLESSESRLRRDQLGPTRASIPVIR